MDVCMLHVIEQRTTNGHTIRSGEPSIDSKRDAKSGSKDHVSNRSIDQSNESKESKQCTSQFRVSRSTCRRGNFSAFRLCPLLGRSLGFHGRDFFFLNLIIEFVGGAYRKKQTCVYTHRAGGCLCACLCLPSDPISRPRPLRPVPHGPNSMSAASIVWAGGPLVMSCGGGRASPSECG